MKAVDEAAADSNTACRHCGGSGREADARPVAKLYEPGRQQELADAINRDPSTVSKIANGKKAPGLMTAILIAKHLGTTVDRVVKNREIMQKLMEDAAA